MGNKWKLFGGGIAVVAVIVIVIVVASGGGSDDGGDSVRISQADQNAAGLSDQQVSQIEADTVAYANNPYGDGAVTEDDLAMDAIIAASNEMAILENDPTGDIWANLEFTDRLKAKAIAAVEAARSGDITEWNKLVIAGVVIPEDMANLSKNEDLETVYLGGKTVRVKAVESNWFGEIIFNSEELIELAY